MSPTEEDPMPKTTRFAFFLSVLLYAGNINASPMKKAYRQHIADLENRLSRMSMRRHPASKIVHTSILSHGVSWNDQDLQVNPIVEVLMKGWFGTCFRMRFAVRSSLIVRNHRIYRRIYAITLTMNRRFRCW